MASSSTKQHKAPEEAHDTLGAQLSHLYFEKDLSLRQLSALIGGVSPDSVRRCMAGSRLRARTAHKIERFLRGVTANAA